MLHSPERFAEWLPALFDGQFHWDFILPAFTGTKITPMDIDCCIERNNHFLMVETKKPGEVISVGQQITLTNLWKNGRVSIIHLEGKTPETISGYSIYHEWEKTKTDKIGDRPIVAKNAFDVLFLVRRWFCKVNKLPIPTRPEWDRELWLQDYAKAR